MVTSTLVICRTMLCLDKCLADVDYIYTHHKYSSTPCEYLNETSLEKLLSHCSSLNFPCNFRWIVSSMFLARKAIHTLLENEKCFTFEADFWHKKMCLVTQVFLNSGDGEWWCMMLVGWSHNSGLWYGWLSLTAGYPTSGTHHRIGRGWWGSAILGVGRAWE